MKIMLDEGDAVTVANALAKSRGFRIDFSDIAFGPGSLEDTIYTEALRVIAALVASRQSIGLSPK